MDGVELSQPAVGNRGNSPPIGNSMTACMCYGYLVRKAVTYRRYRWPVRLLGFGLP